MSGLDPGSALGSQSEQAGSHSGHLGQVPLFLGELVEATGHGCRASLEPGFQHLPCGLKSGQPSAGFLSDEPKNS